MNPPEFLSTPVESSRLTSVASTDPTLQLEFRSGAVYRYFAVPPTVSTLRSPPNPKGRTSTGVSGIGFATSGSLEAHFPRTPPNR
jgi:hypothetical protein